MTTLSTRDTATGADAAPALTDGIHLVVDALKLNDVHTIYGVVGIPITDLARVAQASGIRYIGFRHESDAGHAAAAAGFLTKKPGICLTVSAPGLPQRTRGAGQRHDELLSDGPDLRVERAAYRRPQARRLRGNRPARGGRAVRQGRVPGVPGRGHRSRHRPGDPDRGVRPPRRCLPRHPGRSARRGYRRRRAAAHAVAGRRPGTAPATRARGGRPRDRAARRCATAAGRARQGRRILRRRTSRSERSSRPPACRTCRCRWPRACCPTTTRSRRPPPVRWRCAKPMS